MKFPSLLFAFAVVLLTSSSLRAEASATAPSAATQSAEETAALEKFLSMNDAQLDQLQQAIAKVRAMSPAQRSALKAKMLSYRALPETERSRVREAWGWVDDKDRGDWPQMMRSLSNEGRSAIQAEVQSLAPEKRASRKHEILEAWRAGK